MSVHGSEHANFARKTNQIDTDECKFPLCLARHRSDTMGAAYGFAIGPKLAQSEAEFDGRMKLLDRVLLPHQFSAPDTKRIYDSRRKATHKKRAEDVVPEEGGARGELKTLLEAWPNWVKLNQPPTGRFR